MIRALFEHLLRLPRQWIQIASALLMNSYITQQWTKGIPCPGLNCYSCPAAIFACPIGSLQHFAALRQIPLYPLGVLTLIGALIGRGACGWLCPFGWLQELLYRIPVPKREPNWHPPARRWPYLLAALIYAAIGLTAAIAHLQPGWLFIPYLLLGFLASVPLGWSRYFTLIALVFIVPYFTAEPWFSKLCPQGTLEAGIPVLLLQPELRAFVGLLFWIKIAILLLFLLWMTLIKRPFCRWACPLGALWAPFNRISAVRLEIDEAHCGHCDRCREVCPVDILVYDDPNSLACIRCMECVRACPTSAIQIRSL